MTKLDRILVIGEDKFFGHSEIAIVKGVAWKSFDDSINPRDFNIVIVVRDSLNSNELERKQSDAILNKLTFETATKILTGSNGRIVIIGDPVTEFKLSGRAWSPCGFMGVQIKLAHESGEAIYKSNTAVGYENRIKSYNYAMSFFQVDRAIFEDVFSRSDDLDLEFTHNVFTRYHHAVACDFRFKRRGYVILEKFTLVPTLPQGPSESVRIFLEENCGFRFQSDEPAWVLDIVAPNQELIDSDIDRLNEQIVTLQTSLHEQQKSRANTRKCLKLLYGGDFELEEIALEVLEALGASVTYPPPRVNKEDGWISVVTQKGRYLGVLEIKSTKNKMLPEEGRKQLHDWVHNGIELGIAYRGIYIGNPDKDSPVVSRPDPFSDSWKNVSRSQKISVLLTSHLYRAYQDLIAGSFEHDLFWEQLFETDGVIDFPLPLGLVKSDEDEAL